MITTDSINFGGLTARTSKVEGVTSNPLSTSSNNQSFIGTKFDEQDKKEYQVAHASFGSNPFGFLFGNDGSDNTVSAFAA
ncbi:hypothetical protein IJV79_00760 [bacterium]|nr:hypothetical protein [bacterium]